MTVSSDVFSPAIDSNLAPDQRAQLISLLNEFRSSFDFPQAPLGRTNTVVHRIHIGTNTPLRQRPYRVSPAECRIITKQVNDMLQRGVIKPSCSLWSSPVVLVKKRDGSIRFCVDYRRLNKITSKDVYPFPRIDDALDCLQGENSSHRSTCVRAIGKSQWLSVTVQKPCSSHQTACTN